MNNKVSSNELLVLSVLLSVCFFPGFGNYLIIAKSNTTAIFVTLVGSVLSFGILIILLFITKVTEKTDIFTYNTKVFKFFGYIINGIIILTTIYLLIIMSWHCLNFIISQFLTKTPYYFIIIIGFGIILYGIKKGKETFSRATLILFYIFILFTFLIFISLIGKTDINNIKPIFNIKADNFFESLWMYCSLSTTPIFLLICFKRKNIVDKENFNKKIIFGFIIGMLIEIIFMFFIISILGIDLSLLYGFPEYAILKKIKSFEFIQRIQNIASIIVFIVYFVNLSMMLFFIKDYIRHLFITIKKNNISKNQNLIINILITLIGFITPFISVFVFINGKANFLFIKFHYYTLPLYIVFIIIFISFIITKKSFYKETFITD